MSPGESAIGIDLLGLQDFSRCLQRMLILEEITKKQDETIAELRTALEKASGELAAKERELALERRENELNQKMNDLYKKEAEIYKNAFDREKDLYDQALKLAEASKPKSNWQLQGLGVLAAIILGMFLEK